MGAAGLAAGVVVLVAVAVLLVLALLGLSLLIVGAMANARRGSRPLVWTGAALLATVGVCLIAVLAWVRLTADPDTLRLDLREPVSAASLDKDDMPGFPGVYDYDSDQVVLVLPDGARFASDADAVTVWTDAGAVTSVRLNRNTAPRDEAADIVRHWAADLGVATPGLDDSGEGAWSTTDQSGGADVRLSLQPVAGGNAKPFLSVDVSSTGAAQ